jgi:hypothetical protein
VVGFHAVPIRSAKREDRSDSAEHGAEIDQQGRRFQAAGAQHAQGSEHYRHRHGACNDLQNQIAHDTALSLFVLRETAARRRWLLASGSRL